MRESGQQERGRSRLGWVEVREAMRAWVPEVGGVLVRVEDKAHRLA